MTHVMEVYIQSDARDARNWWVVVAIDGEDVERLGVENKEQARLVAADIVEMGVSTGGTRIF